MSRPADWSPLRGSDPTPGDPAAVAALAKRYSDTALTIRDQAQRLRRAAGRAGDGWRGKAADVFRSHGDDLAQRIEKAHDRYAATGTALAGFARVIGPLQDEADEALRLARQAQQDLDSLAGAPRPPATDPEGSPHQPTPDEQAAQRRNDAARAAAQDQLRRAHQLVDAAEADYQRAATHAADAISDAIGHDGVHDSWWDRHAQWLKDALKIIAVVVVAITVVALVIALVVPGLNIACAAALLAVAETMQTAATVLSLAMGVGDSVLAATGKGSWTDVAMDAVGVLTLGLGAGVGAMAKGARAVGATVKGTRAGVEAFEAAGHSGIVYRLATQSGTVRSIVSLLPRVGTDLAEADRVAATASRTIEDLEVAVPATPLLALTGGDVGLAKNIALTLEVDQQVPGVLRLRALRAGTLGAGGGLGLWNWYSGANAAQHSYHDWFSDPASQSEIDQHVAETINRYRCPVVPVP